MLNQIGLILGILGTIGMFFFGLPSKVKTTEGESLSVGDLPDDEVKKIEADNKKINRNANISLILVILSFILQFISTLVCIS